MSVHMILRMMQMLMEYVEMYDQCPGYDDNIDTDDDGVANGCDQCPLDANDDSDGDGSCDSDDICPGEDDFLDTDEDTVVDCLDECPLDFIRCRK